MNAVGLGGRSPVHILQREKREVLRDLAVTGPGRGRCAAETAVRDDSKHNVRTTFVQSLFTSQYQPPFTLATTRCQKIRIFGVSKRGGTQA
jgi:hypothetical protein